MIILSKEVSIKKISTIISAALVFLIVYIISYCIIFFIGNRMTGILHFTCQSVSYAVIGVNFDIV